MPSFIIGFTGRTASGKSTASDILADKLKDCTVMDVDSLAKDIYCKEKSAVNGLRNIFGQGAIKDDGIPDFSYIADMVFSDHRLLEDLNALMFPYIRKEVKKRLKRLKGFKYVIIDAAVLFDCSLDVLCDYIVIIESDRDIRKHRLEKRSEGIDKINLDIRIDGQHLSLFEHKADQIIINDGDMKKLISDMDRLAKKISGIKRR